MKTRLIFPCGVVVLGAMWNAVAQVPATAPAVIDPARAAKAREWIDMALREAAGKQDGMLSMAIRDVASARVLLGDLAGARALAETVTDPEGKAFTLWDIAEMQIDRNDSAGARQTLAEAVKVAGPQASPFLLQECAELQAQAGDVAGALATAQWLKPSSEKAEALTMIGVAQMKAGNAKAANVSFVAALEMLRNIKEEFPLFDAGAVAEQQAVAGDIPAARATLAQLTDNGMVASALIGVAKVQSDAGDLAGAKASLADARKDLAATTDSHMLRALAHGYVEIHDFTTARAVLVEARKVVDPTGNMRAVGLFQIALECDLINDPEAAADFSAAQNALAASKDSRDRAWILWGMAVNDVDMGIISPAADYIARAQKEKGMDDDEVTSNVGMVVGGIVRTDGAKADLAWVKTMTAEQQAIAYATAARWVLNSGENPAVARLKIQVDAGNVDAMSLLGYRYEKGDGVSKDAAQAFSLYLKAATAGDADAMFDVACAYEDGEGTGKDFAQAINWYRKAAAKNDTTSMAFLGSMYRNGKGVPVDFAQAMTWYRKAADGGNAYAMDLVGDLYSKGQGVKQDDAQAFAWYRKSADGGNSSAMNDLADMYRHGRGTKLDFAQAMAWFKKAADAGEAPALTNVGELYRDGQGVPKDATEAMKWLQKAAAKGRSAAMGDIAEMYEKGNGVSKDLTQARAWYERAAAAGSQVAKDWIAQHSK